MKPAAAFRDKRDNDPGLFRVIKPLRNEPSLAYKGSRKPYNRRNAALARSALTLATACYTLGDRSLGRYQVSSELALSTVKATANGTGAYLSLAGVVILHKCGAYRGSARNKGCRTAACKSLSFRCSPMCTH